MKSSLYCRALIFCDENKGLIETDQFSSPNKAFTFSQKIIALKENEIVSARYCKESTAQF
jgi:hypothetical protein